MNMKMFIALLLVLALQPICLYAEATVNGHRVYNTMEELINPEHAAIIVVDMQNDWISTEGIGARKDKDREPDPKAHKVKTEYTEQVRNMQKFLEAARKNKIYITYAEYIHQTREGAMLVPECELWASRNSPTVSWAREGTWGSRTIDELAPQKGELVIHKSRGNSFYKTYLEDALRDQGKRCLILTGTMSGGCVLATAIGALERGFYPVLVRDCIDQEPEAIKFLEVRFPMYRANEIIAAWQKMSAAKSGPAEKKSAKAERK